MNPPEEVEHVAAADEASRPFAGLPAIVRLNEIRVELDISQAEMGRRFDCTQPTMSEVLGGKARFGSVRRAAAWRLFGVPFDAWLTPEERGHGAPHDAHPCEAPQAAQMPRDPAFSATATGAAPVSQVSP